MRGLERLLELGASSGARRLAIAGALIGGLAVTLQVDRMVQIYFQPQNDAEQYKRHRKTENTAVFRQLDALVPPGYVVFNCPALFDDLDAMFFSNCQVYGWVPDEAIHQELKRRGIPIAVFDHPDGLKAPEYLKNDPDVLLIRKKLLRE